MPLTLNKIIEVLENIPKRNVKITKEQLDIIKQDNGPLWIIAGPGSGKTEVLVLRCLKLLYVNKIPPHAILITTFTERAAKNIQDRIASYKEYITNFDSSLKEIDVSDIRVGTLHSLCNDIMQEYRYSDYQNVRVLNDLEQPLFIYDNSILTYSKPPDTHLKLWQKFNYLLEQWDPISGFRWNGISMPSRWRRTRATVILFNRIVEDLVDIKKMKARSGIWTILADAYEQYEDTLANQFRCDFAHIQKKFLKFLKTPRGRQFLDGEANPEHPGIKYVLVDEYQDTNPIQEEIYLNLAANEPHNLNVVGDDDQALYRFRGGTVECMVTFDKACKRAWGLSSTQVGKLPLISNYRSHPQIVNWCNDYIESFDVMKKSGARAPNKPKLKPSSMISGDHPAVAVLERRKPLELAESFADLVHNLLIHKIINRPSQCALLLKSTREVSKWAGLYVTALNNRGILTYNPRSRALLQQPEVMGALGGIVEILDPSAKAQDSVRGDGIHNMVNEWRQTFLEIRSGNTKLKDYITKARNRISGTEKRS